MERKLWASKWEDEVKLKIDKDDWREATPKWQTGIVSMYIYYTRGVKRMMDSLQETVSTQKIGF